MSKGWGDPEPSDDEKRFIPLSDYEELHRQNEQHKERIDFLFEENEQLKEALTKINAGIHKANKMVEGLAHTNDQKLITNMAMNLLKHHPKRVSVEYRGEQIINVFQDLDEVEKVQ